jgi:indolepyruvate ferredoxin oxidoreductase, beta subunit
MENRVTNILLVGVGGQGIILASEIMSDVFLAAGFDTKKSEVHGMAQRGGSVSTHVRFGEKVYSPLIKDGEVDIFMAFEELEALRYLSVLRPNAAILLNEERLNPPSVSLGNEAYPADVSAVLSQRSGQFKAIPGRDLAVKAGDVRAVNIVLLGALSRVLSIPEDVWLDPIVRRFPPKAEAINRRAFNFGRSM